MNARKFKLWLFILKIVTILILSSFIITTIIITIDNWPLSLKLNTASLKRFIDIYKIAYDFGGVSIIFLTIWLTLERMNQTEIRIKQTQNQLNTIEENNKFNNFYKHRDEFKKYMSETTIYKIFDKYKIDMQINAIYSLFYTKSYLDFKPHMNLNFKFTINDYLNSVKDSILNRPNSNLISINIVELFKISNKGDIFINQLIRSLSDSMWFELINNLKKTKSSAINHKEQSYVFMQLNEIYFTIILYELIKQFDGEEIIPFSYFISNYKIYLDNFYPSTKLFF